MGLALTIVVDQDDGPIPAILEEGRCWAEHTLGLDLARGSIHLQPVLGVIILEVTVGQGGEEQGDPEPMQDPPAPEVWSHIDTHIHSSPYTHSLCAYTH